MILVKVLLLAVVVGIGKVMNFAIRSRREGHYLCVNLQNYIDICGIAELSQ